MKINPDKDLSGNSINWKNWETELKITTCSTCFNNHGKIYSETVNENDILPLHPNGHCKLPYMRTKQAGTATKLGPIGVDARLCYLKQLPDYYVTKQTAIKNGWKPRRGNLADVLPNKLVGNDIFYNTLEKLPVQINRIWWEADFDYVSGYRNHKRILYSNDGLLFVTYDHYQTFYEILP